MKNYVFLTILIGLISITNIANAASFVVNNGPGDSKTGVPPKRPSLVKSKLNTGLPISSNTGSDKKANPHLEMSRFPTPRTAIPHSLKGRIAQPVELLKQQKTSSLECSENSLCASFEENTTVKDVSAWMGFETENGFGKFFVATYGQEATHLGNNLYSTPKWDENHFWINIGGGTVPLPIQPRFVGKDVESNSEWHMVDYVGYKKAGIDYSNYANNLSLSSLILLINPTTKEVERSYIQYFDENDVYVEDYELEIGDALQSYFLGFKKGEDDAVYLFTLEVMKPIAKKVIFSYNKQYPGKDFNCTYCEEVDLGQVELKYMFESFDINRSTFTNPEPIEKNSNVTSSSKSVSISGFWIFFVLSMFVAIVIFNNEHKLRKN